MTRLLLISAILLATTVTHARAPRDPIWGIRPLGMGNAFLAISDDANAPFYNPAALARVKGLHWNVLDITVGADNMDTLNRMKGAVLYNDLQNLIRTDAKQFMELGAKSMFVAPYFAFGVYDGFQGFFDINNLLSLEAKVDILSVNDVGAIAAIGIPAGDNLSFGVSVRGVQRTGLDVELSAADLLEQAQATKEEFLSSIYDRVKGMGGLGLGIGLNAGVLFQVPLKTKSPRLQLAATAEDIGQTTFTGIGSNFAPAPIRPSYHFGASFKYTLSKDTDLNVAADLRNNFEPVPFLKAFHLGGELRHKVFGLRAGASHGYLTLGASLEFPPHTRLHFATYTVELGADRFESPHRWYVLQLVIGFNPL